MLTEEQRLSLAISFRLTPSMAKAFALLLEAPLATNKMIEACVDGDGTPAKMIIYRLRSQLKHTSIKINKRAKAGYWIDAGTKAYVMRTIEDNIRFVALESKELTNANSNLGLAETI